MTSARAAGRDGLRSSTVPSNLPSGSVFRLVTEPGLPPTPASAQWAAVRPSAARKKAGSFLDRVQVEDEGGVGYL